MPNLKQTVTLLGAEVARCWTFQQASKVWQLRLRPRRMILLLASLLMFSATIRTTHSLADEGMWLFNALADRKAEGEVQLHAE